MKLLVILSLVAALTLESEARLIAVKRRRESKWDIIHHEYHGPPAPLDKDGRVIDTPEVALAKANHLAIHAETVIDLAKKMAAAELAEKEAEAAKASSQASEPKSESSPAAEVAAEPAAPIVAAPVEMTPELMAMLMEAAAVEELQKLQSESSASEAPKAEETAEAAPAAPTEAAKTAEPAKADAAPVESTSAEPEIKPIIEFDSNNEVDAVHPIHIIQRNYEGPLAPIGEDGRVLDTFEVRKAKEAHFAAYEMAIKLAKKKESAKKEDGQEEPSIEWYKPKSLFQPSAPVQLLYSQDGPLGYKGPAAPIDKSGRVIDTTEVEKAKAEHRKAHEHAESVAKRHPPKPEDNLV